MSQIAAIKWWDQSLTEMGIQGMEKLVPRDASWTEMLRFGEKDLQRCLLLTGMKTGKDLSVLDLGCGVGRLSQALGKVFGKVVGIDVAPSLIQEANLRNQSSHVSFAVGDGESLAVAGHSGFDTVFSYEVLYVVPPQYVANYFREAAAQLKPDGELVFQLNCAPMTSMTYVSCAFRDLLAAVGVKKFRGWPTGKGFRRYPFSVSWVKRALLDAGLRLEAVTDVGRPQQTWFVARKVVLPL